MTNKGFATDLLNLLYPRQCTMCKIPLTDRERQICASCARNLHRTHYCTDRRNRIRGLYAGYPQLKDASAFLFYEKDGITQRLVHLFKYNGDTMLAESLGRLAAAEHQANGFYTSIDCVVPVPLHRRKEKLRKYNQSAWIASGFAAVYGCKAYPKALVRIAETDTQTMKTTYDRNVNVENVFKITDVERLRGKHVLLVDDVLTTGATTSACMNILADVPGITLSVFVLAVVR